MTLPFGYGPSKLSLEIISVFDRMSILKLNERRKIIVKKIFEKRT
jgi:hypothetical protein